MSGTHSVWQADSITVRRLQEADGQLARELFQLMSKVFEEESDVQVDTQLRALLRQENFVALAAWEDEVLVGGLTAHVLPMTRVASFEVFIYDVAVAKEAQRRGVGRTLMAALRDMFAGRTIFVAADEEDAEAITFYRALGGEESGTRFFVFRK